MKQIIILFLIVKYSLAFECSQYSSQGCSSCVSNINTLTDGCVWCGFVDIEDGSISGNCYYYGDMNTACQNLNNNNIPDPTQQIYIDIQFYGCCYQQFRIGSNVDITCQNNFTSIVTAKSNHILLIYFVYFWVIGFIAIFYIHYLFARNIVNSFLIASAFPILWIAIFFYDSNLNPNFWVF